MNPPSGPAPGELPPHGTRARYVSRQAPCNCDECKAANAAYMADYRRKNYDRIQRKRRRNREAKRKKGS